jgi:hypothetical protein
MAAQRFKRGDHVSWNPEAGRVRGRITRVIKNFWRCGTEHSPREAHALIMTRSILKGVIAFTACGC